MLLGATAFGLTLVLVLGGGLAAGHTSSAVARTGRAGTELPAGTAATTSAAATYPLSLDIGSQPAAICAATSLGCPAGTGLARVGLSANPAAGPTAAWPAVQIAFVIETTSYDGVLGTDRSDQLDKCAAVSSTAPACEESNGVPFFVANAQQIANAIQLANPRSAVSFALVDYYDAAGEPWDDTDGPEYNVDIGTFVPANAFGSLVRSTFQQTVMGGTWYSWDQDLDNNFLDSSSITALYGAIIGSDLNWTNNAHHVIVWMGSSAPRDPSYPEDYCVSPSEWNVWGPPSDCFSQTCEPSYAFANGVSPQCEGWVHSQDGNPADSIAALAHTAPACVGSIGGTCTIDTIDLWTTTTDPLSPGWPAASSFVKIGGGPGGREVQANVANVIAAGCDLAAATGGSWSGPGFESCPNGLDGNLQYVNFGSSIDSPNLNNPSLFEAFRTISFGPVFHTELAAGTDVPMFEFVAYGTIQVAPAPEWSVVCDTPTGFLSTCQRAPTILHQGGMTYFGWNFSTVAADNQFYVGDAWSVEFYVVATGPPYALVPVDACTTTTCIADGSGSLNGLFTRATYLAQQNTTLEVQSFPPAQVTVEPSTSPLPPPSVPPAPPPAPPGILAPVIAPVPIAAPIPLASTVGIGNVSVQAAAAGFLGAGFMRVTVRNRPIAMAVAAKSGLASSRFEKVSETPPTFSRME